MMSGQSEKELVEEINELKTTISTLKQKIHSFETDPSEQDEFAKQNYLEDKRRLMGLVTYHTKLHDALWELRAQLASKVQGK